MRRVLLIFALALIFAAAFLFFSKNNKELVSDSPCVTKVATEIVKGASLTGLVADGSAVRVAFGYYSCRVVERNDLVLYNYAGSVNPLIKIAKGLPGDTFSLKEGPDGYYLLINGEILENSKGEPYMFDANRKKLLELYISDYKGVIPEGSYLIFGNIATGTTDSSRFGLVSIRDLLGKATPVRN